MKRDSSESAGIKQRKSPFEADLELEILPWLVAFNRKDSSATSTMEPEDSDARKFDLPVRRDMHRFWPKEWL